MVKVHISLTRKGDVRMISLTVNGKNYTVDVPEDLTVVYD